MPGRASPIETVVDQALVRARDVRERAHAPHSGFAVGAAVVLPGGETFVGCNVESASYGLTLCAERSALASMFAARPTDPGGQRGGDGSHDVVVVAIVTEAVAPTPPCGACRQWLAEFAPDALVVAEAAAGVRARWTVAELLPDAFTGDALPGV